MNILRRPAIAFYNVLPLKLALKANSRAFLASKCVQKYLDNEWYESVDAQERLNRGSERVSIYILRFGNINYKRQNINLRVKQFVVHYQTDFFEWLLLRSFSVAFFYHYCHFYAALYPTYTDINRWVSSANSGEGRRSFLMEHPQRGRRRCWISVSRNDTYSFVVVVQSKFRSSEKVSQSCDESHGSEVTRAIILLVRLEHTGLSSLGRREFRWSQKLSFFYRAPIVRFYYNLVCSDIFFVSQMYRGWLLWFG